MNSDKQYWAFISYSSKDKKWGQWLHKRLENYPIPEEFQGQELFDGAVLGKNLRPVFRDRDELAGSSELGPAIETALQSTRFLIVLCSRNSAQSEWVNKEIADFKAMGKEGHILALILDGEPNATSQGKPEEECFPPELRYPAEPLAGDLRKEGDGKERGFLKILAGIAQLDFDKLYRRHERAQAKKRFTAGIVAFCLIALFASLAAFALQQKGIAEVEREQAQEELAIYLIKSAFELNVESAHDALIRVSEPHRNWIWRFVRNYIGPKPYELKEADALYRRVSSSVDDSTWTPDEHHFQYTYQMGEYQFEFPIDTAQTGGRPGYIHTKSGIPILSFGTDPSCSFRWVAPSHDQSTVVVQPSGGGYIYANTGYLPYEDRPFAYRLPKKIFPVDAVSHDFSYEAGFINDALLFYTFSDYSEESGSIDGSYLFDLETESYQPSLSRIPSDWNKTYVSSDVSSAALLTFANNHSSYPAGLYPVTLKSVFPEHVPGVQLIVDEASGLLAVWDAAKLSSTDESRKFQFHDRDSFFLLVCGEDVIIYYSPADSCLKVLYLGSGESYPLALENGQPLQWRDDGPMRYAHYKYSLSGDGNYFYLSYDDRRHNSDSFLWKLDDTPNLLSRNQFGYVTSDGDEGISYSFNEYLRLNGTEVVYFDHDSSAMILLNRRNEVLFFPTPEAAPAWKTPIQKSFAHSWHMPKFSEHRDDGLIHFFNYIFRESDGKILFESESPLRINPSWTRVVVGDRELEVIEMVDQGQTSDTLWAPELR